MYESFFGFVKRPFLAVSTLDRYFPATSIEQTFQTTARAIQRGEGPVAIFGGSGLGKTMCCLRIAENFRRNFEVVMLASSQLITRRALLQSLLFELRMPYRDMSEGELRLTLMNRLQPSTENPTDGLVLIVDEAQTLSIKLLEELRLLTNVVRNGVPRVRMVLCGTMRLEECLSHPHMESLNQRLAARCYLTPLSLQETGQYVTHKIELSGVSSSSVMTRDALEAIYRGSDGIPRLIDQLADQALMLACNDKERPVSASMVGRAWCMLQQLPNPWSEPESIAKSDSKSPFAIQPTPTVAVTTTVAPPQTTTPALPVQLSALVSAGPLFAAFQATQPTEAMSASPSPTTTKATQSTIEFGQLDDDFESDETSDPTPASYALMPESIPAFATPDIVTAVTESPRNTTNRTSNATNEATPKKNLFDVFAGDFDEEFSIPVQSSNSYKSYSGAAYGNLNHDLSSFGAQQAETHFDRKMEIEEANEFLSHPFSAEPNLLSQAFQVQPSSNEPASMAAENNYSFDQADASEPVSNISPEQAAILERQIEEEMRELVSGLNMNAMTFDPSSTIDMIANGPVFQHDTASYETRIDAQRLAHQAHSDVISFAGLNTPSETYGNAQRPAFDRAAERAAMNDDRDLLVIEDELEAVRSGAQQATIGSSRAVMHPYAKLFTKLRNS